MKAINNFLKDYKDKYTNNDKLIMLLAVSLFLPYIITAIVVVLLGLYILIKKDFFMLMKDVKRSNFVLIFCFYLLIVSLLSQNWLGALISVGMIFVFVVTIFYCKHIHKDLFEKILDLMIFMSLIAVVYAIMEQYFYSSTLEGIISYFDINNKPQYRVHTFFFNANYYAMMIIFVELFCAYKFMGANKKGYYAFAGLLNLFAMFLTGSRFAWLCLLVALIAMFILNRNFKILGVTLTAATAAVVAMFFDFPLIPRLLEYGVSLGRRKVVYETSFLMIRDKWLFGEGPLTYLHRYPEYLNEYISKYGSEHLTDLGISSQHAHSMFLDPLISFGLVGTVLFLVYLFSQFIQVFRLFKSKRDRSLVALIVGTIVAVVSSNVVDYPIFWLQTGLLFLLVLGSVYIHINKSN